MSMEDWPDNHLDDLFRKSAEEHDVPYDTDDWTVLSRRLDERDRGTWFEHISRWTGFGALLLLLLGGLSWLLPLPGTTRRTAQRTIPPTAPAAQRQPAPARSARFGKTVNQTTPLASVNQTNATAPLPPAPPAQQAATTTYPQPRADRQPAASVAVKNVPSRSATARPRVTSATRRPPDLVTEQPVLSGTDRAARSAPIGRSILDNQAIETPQKRRAQQQANQIGEQIGPISNVPDTVRVATNERVEPATAAAQKTVDARWLPVLAPLTNLSAVVQPTATNIPQVQAVVIDRPAQQPASRLSRFSVFVFAAPDLSAIGLKNFERPGSSMGVSVQYQLTDRLSLNTGAMLSTKIYQASATEYAWPNYWNWKVWPVGVDGRCTMVDVPLNLRYDWLLRPRGDGRAPARWFASAGLTSYFIRREIYNYQYDNPADPRIGTADYYRRWDNEAAGEPGGSFGFSNLNVSMGYERPLTRRLSWQIEPFLKVPLKEVGFFKVRLLSTGAFVGLRYQF